MTGFLKAVKADLLDRRMLPLLIVLGAAFVGAVAYAALGGGSTTATPTAATATAGTPSAAGIAISQPSAGTDQAVAETTSGAPHQRGGLARDPFRPLPSAPLKTPASTSSSAGSSSKTSGSSTSTPSSTGSGGTSPAPASPPAQPAKPKPPAPVYNVAVQFGPAPVGTPPQGPPLTSYAKLKRLTLLPSSKQPLVVFMGVTAGGKSATFTIVGETIIKGSGACIPNASQCEAIDLKPGQAEQLEYLPPSGPAVIYELKVVKISRAKATTASARIALSGEAKAGRELLRRAGRLTVPGLRYSASKGVLVAVARPRSAHADAVAPLRDGG
jgi:hypothetical protein